MPNAYIIMGDANSRKSSTIRALTGKFKRGPYDIKLTDGSNIPVYVQIRALQEAEETSQDFIRMISSQNCIHVILSLRIESVTSSDMTEFHDGGTYIQDFINANWNIRNIFVFGSGRLPYGLPAQSPTPIFFPNSRTTPANELASNIRNILHWL
jgi:hypothetical protein